MQINGSRIYVNESRGVIGPMFLRVRGFIGFVVSWASWFHGFIGFVVSWFHRFHRFHGLRGFMVS